MSWHEDFFAEAVKEDLGKSGIKVAETLEIQKGPTEWWRLISSASPATVRGYIERRIPEPLIDGGTLDLSTLGMDGILAYTHGSFKTFADMERPQVFWFSDGSKVLAQVSRGLMRAYNFTTETEWEKPMTVYSSVSRVYGPWMYFDYVNNRILTKRSTALTSGRTVQTWDKDGNQLSYSTASVNHVHASAYAFRSFPEEPSKIYSLFWEDGGKPSVKITTPTVGQDPVTQSDAIMASTAGAVTVNDFENVTWSASIPRLHMFYFRSAGSVALSWFDETKKRVKYVLEVDGWNTVYTMPDIFTRAPSSVTGIGNFVTEMDGEFIVARSEITVTGNLAKPSGYSYPANLVILGVCKGVGDKDFLMFGNVGSNLYAFSIDGDTMDVTHTGWCGTPGVKFLETIPLFCWPVRVIWPL